MFYELFVSRHRKIQDRKELDNLFDKYGYETINTLRARANDPSLSMRDRKHWRRLMRCAKVTRPKCNGRDRQKRLDAPNE